MVARTLLEFTYEVCDKKQTFSMMVEIVVEEHDQPNKPLTGC
jgi:hypothetical protein